MLKKKLIQKLETIAILQVNTEVQHIVFVTEDFNLPNEIPVVFHNRSSYDNNVIIKELAN